MRTQLVLGAIGLAAALISSPAFAQTATPSCLFPLACPGAVPPKPEPLYGPPEDQAAAEQPAQPTTRVKHHARKHAAAKAKTTAN